MIERETDVAERSAGIADAEPAARDSPGRTPTGRIRDVPGTAGAAWDAAVRDAERARWDRIAEELGA